MDLKGTCDATGKELPLGIRATGGTRKMQGLGVRCPHCGRTHYFDIVGVDVTARQPRPAS